MCQVYYCQKDAEIAELTNRIDFILTQFDDFKALAFAPDGASWKDKLAKLEEKARAAMLALESLTPGGSEFAGDVERCAAFARETRQRQAAAIIKFKLESNVAQDELVALEARFDDPKVREDVRMYLHGLLCVIGTGCHDARNKVIAIIRGEAGETKA